MLDGLIQFFTTYGYFAVFGVLLLSGFGLPIPEDISLVAGGFISSLACPYKTSFIASLQECHQVHIMFFIGMAGVLIGDSTMFFIGHIFGKKVLNFKLFSILIKPERFEWAQRNFEKYGSFLIFAARFMPGLRSLLFLVAGITHRVKYIKFLFIDGFAALISVPFWVYFGYWGERQLSDMSALENYIKRGELSIFVIIGIAIFTVLFVWYVRKKIKEKTKFFQ